MTVESNVNISDSDEKEEKNRFKLVPPDGGWGYIVLLSLIAYNLIIVEQCSTFGLVYGPFLAAIGDETSQTALIANIFLSLQSIAGVFSNVLLGRFSLRQLGLAGAFTHVLGMICSIFAQTFSQMLICYSILEGLGSGFMLCATFSSFGNYFSKRANLVMGIAQTVSLLGVVVAPLLINFIMENLGFRKTLGVMTGIALLNILGMSALEPVEKHMKKILIEDNNETLIDLRQENIVRENLVVQTEPLLEDNIKRVSTVDDALRTSLETLGKVTASLGHLSQTSRKEKLFDFSLLKSPKFLNVSFGVGLSLIADITSDALLPSLLEPFGYTSSEIAYMMTVSFGCDLASRILFSIISGFFNFKIRPVFMVGSLFMAIFRTAFAMNFSYLWTIVSLGLYGTVRCIIKTCAMLCIVEEFRENFKYAFSLAMVLTGVVSLIFGGLASLIKKTTQDNMMVVHLLSLANILCLLCWSIEMAYRRLKLKSSLA